MPCWFIMLEQGRPCTCSLCSMLKPTWWAAMPCLSTMLEQGRSCAFGLCFVLEADHSMFPMLLEIPLFQHFLQQYFCLLSQT